jgi:hypothetical protein
METIEQVGALLGLAAFFALAVLALLYFQQGREVRRLRDWAGRAPERAAAAVAREAEAEAEQVAAAETIAKVTPLGKARARVAAWGQRMPIDPLYVMAILVGLVVAVGFVTDGFGVLGGEEQQPVGQQTDQTDQTEDRDRPETRPPDKIRVAVLNATQVDDVVGGVPGLGDAVGELITAAGFKLVSVENAVEGVPESLVEFSPGSRPEALRVANRLKPQLGELTVTQITSAIENQVGGVEVAVVIGQEDASLSVPPPGVSETDGGVTTEPAPTPTTPAVPGV